MQAGQVFHFFPQASQQGLAQFLSAAPAQLAPWVQCIWVVEQSIPAEYIGLKLYPDAGVSVTIRPTDAGFSIFAEQNLQVRFATEHDFKRCVCIRFKPGGLHQLLNIDMAALKSGAIDLTQLNNTFVNELQHSLIHSAAQSMQEVKQHAVAYLLQRAASGVKKNTNIAAFTEHYDYRRDDANKFAATLGLSRRTLERKLQSHVGVSPSQLASLMRIHYARNAMFASDQELALIALACGYYDQAHFNHDFVKRTLETPAQYRQRKLAQIYNR